MAVSVEVLSGLERKINITIPAEKIKQEVNSRLKKMSSQIKIPGFRPGKVPANIIRQRYYSAVYHEVVQSMIEPTFLEAIKSENLKVADAPKIEADHLDVDQDFIYTALIEVLPEFELHELDKAEVEIVSAQLSTNDVDNMIEKLRKENMQWAEVDEKLKLEDKAVIDFTGFIDDKPFEGGAAEDYEITLGSNALIPGFEEALVGKKVGQNFDINLTFPETYGSEELAGKAAKFNVTIKKVMQGTLPELDAEFVKQYIKTDDIEEFKKDITANMQRELDRKLRVLNRDSIFTAFLAKNSIDLPKCLVDREIENLKHEMYHRIFGNEHTENEQIPDFPRELFEEQAIRRVHLGLLMSKYIEHHKLTVAKERVDAMIDELVVSYENPDALRKWYLSNENNLAHIEALVLEDMTAEKILEDATVIKKELSYDQVVNGADKS